MKKIIGITGLQGSGKDTVGDIICKEYNNFYKDSFANILKDAASVLFSWDRKMLAGQTPEDRSKREEKDEFWSSELGCDWTPRKALQILGTELFRNHLHKDFWVIALKRRLMTQNQNVVICDCRFPNEVNMIKSLGGIIIRVERDIPDWFRKVESLVRNGCTQEELLIQVEELKDIHSSEWMWIGHDNPDVILTNDKTISDLAIQLQQKLPTSDT